jgi:hypothetical protein
MAQPSLFLFGFSPDWFAGEIVSLDLSLMYKRVVRVVSTSPASGFHTLSLPRC